MKIIYISLGSFCHPKIFIRETKREIQVSLPFDFNISIHTPGITNYLKQLLTTGDVEIEFDFIEKINLENEVIVQDKNKMDYYHFFKKEDLKIVPSLFPATIEHMKKEKLEEVKQLFRKRFKRLHDILQHVENTILCFLRIENYDNLNWENELKDLTLILSLFKHPNKYLIYTQNCIQEEKHFTNSRQLYYDYSIPIMFFKYYFYDEIFFFKKHIFLQCIQSFEMLLNDYSNIISIEHPFTKIIQKFYIDHQKNSIMSLSNIMHSSTFHMFEEKIVVNDALNGYTVFKKTEKDGFSVYIKVDNL